MNASTALAHDESAELNRGVEMPTARVMRAYAVEAKYEFLRMLRAPAFAGPFLALPVCLYLLFAVVLFGAAVSKDPNAGIFMFMGFSVLGVMGPGMFGFGITVATERDQGLLTLRRALPVPPGASVVARMLMAVMFVAIVMATMVAAAPLGGVRLSAAQMLALSAVNVAGAVPFCAMGYFIGAFASAKSAPAFVNLLYLPMLYLSGFLFPLSQSLKWIARLSPAHHLHQIALRVIGGPTETSLALNLAVLTGVTVVFSALAVRRLQRAG
jgi:ABC-2 type transport system permease protein